MATKSFNRESIVPIYHQIQEILVEEIENGVYKPGDQLPSEWELVEKYKISRNTAERVLTNLVYRGLAYRYQGSGTYVADRKITFSVVAALSYSAEIIGLNKKPASQLIHTEEIPAVNPIAKTLEVTEGEPIYSIQRLRLVDKHPMSLQTSFLPKALVPGLIDEPLTEDSLFKTIKEKYGLMINAATETLQAVKANKYESKKLKIRENDAVFLLERITKLKDGRILEFVKTILRGDQAKFYIELSSNNHAS